MFDPVLSTNDKRFVMFPIQYPEVWKMYKKHLSTFWTAEEILLTDDVNQWKQLTDNERYFLEHILAFFASADGIVSENIDSRFYTEVQMPEARAFYSVQMMMETIHSEVYSLLIDTLIGDTTRKDELFNAIDHYPAIQKMAKWAMKWINSDASYGDRLVAFAGIEGIFFSGPFCAIYWIKEKGTLPGLTFSNELISRDEALHVDFGCLMHSMTIDKSSPETILEIIKSVVELSKEFINESLPCSLIGMNASEMSKYIEYVADRLLVMLNVPKYWKSENPFKWMVKISTQNKTNFFEKRVAEYAKSSFNQNVLSGSRSTGDIQLLDDF